MYEDQTLDSNEPVSKKITGNLNNADINATNES